MHYFTFFIFLAVSITASSQDFLDGWYFNPNQPGSGFNVNTQADITGIALFDFEQNGDNQWGIAVDDIATQGDFFVFQAPLSAPSTGACFECPYTPNQGNSSGDTIRIRFQILPADNGNTIAEVTLRGNTEIYVRNLFRFSSVLDYLLSDWGLTIVQPRGDGTNIVLTDQIRFDIAGTSDGIPFVGGNVVSSNNEIAVALLVSDVVPGAGGIVVIQVENFFQGSDQVWALALFKESGTGFTSFSSNALEDALSGQGVQFFASRYGATLNRNQATPAQAVDSTVLLTDSPDKFRQPTAEVQSVADALVRKLRQSSAE